VASLTSVVNSATVATAPTSCGPGCLQQCVDFTVTGGTSIAYSATATDGLGAQGTAQAAYPVQASTPPVLSFTPIGPSVVQGDNPTFCVQATDDVSVASVSATFEGQAFAGPATSCGARCLQICQAFTVPAQSIVSVVGTAVDGAGTSANATQQYTVVPNQPPVATIQPVAGLVVGKLAQLTGTVTDDESPLHWAEFRVNGVVVGTRVNAPVSGATIQASSLRPLRARRPSSYLLRTSSESSDRRPSRSRSRRRIQPTSPT